VPVNFASEKALIQYDQHKLRLSMIREVLHGDKADEVKKL